jgi:hypothetical protein
VLTVSARDGFHMRAWSQRLRFGTRTVSRGLDIDYDRYAEGEARLGWLNETFNSRADAPLDMDAFLMAFAMALQARLRTERATIAHMKLSFQPQGGLPTQIATVHVARDGALPESAMRLAHPAGAGVLLLNIRAEASPAVLKRAVREISDVPNRSARIELSIVGLDAFTPGRPHPTHRIGTG